MMQVRLGFVPHSFVCGLTIKLPQNCLILNTSNNM
jgi:hypothetical protein